MRNTAFEHCFSLLALSLHLALEFLAGAVCQAEFFQEFISGKVFQVLGNSPNGLNQLSLIVFLVNLELAFLAMELCIEWGVL